MIRPLTALFALLLFAAAALPAHAQGEEAEIRQILQQRDRQIKQILGDETTFTPQQREQLKDVINDAFNFTRMGQAALGPYWTDLTPQQRQDFVAKFEEIIRHNSLRNLDVYRAAVTYDDVSVTGHTAKVTTTTVYDGVSTTVTYDLARSGDDWLVVNFALDDVGTVEGFARSFQSAIRKGGYERLDQALDRKLQQIRAES